MTIIYQNRVATTSLGGFLKLLRAWRGSVYKLLYKELIIFISLYAIISLIYRLALTEDQKRVFESIVMELRSASNVIPLSFLLGFYVTFIVQRWWQQFINVPWPDRWWWTPFVTLLLPDRTLFVMATYLHGFDEKSRMMRRSVARYVLFGLILICRAVSVSVMKRFPTIDHIVQAGFITKEEAEMYEKVQCRYLKFWVPMMWANQVLVTARREGRIQTDFGLRMVIECLADFRDKCSVCFVYDWITVPLVYTQVVTFATYSYFAVALLGQQYLDPSQKHPGYTRDFYFPGFTILQFLFYMGWLKVAEQMINPFGEDDDDYDINWLLDRHTAVAFCLTDHCYGRHPALVRDQFWDDLAADVPYTESSFGSIRPNFLGTTFNIDKPNLENEKMIITDHEELNNLPWHQRSRGKGSITGSVLSLFHGRSTRRSPSQATLESTGSMHGSMHGRMHNLVNGKATRYSVISHEQDEMRRSSVDLPVKDETDNSIKAAFQVRQRANTDSDCIDVESKNRKLSLPIQISPSNKPSSSPKSNRFTIEPVKDSDSEPESSNKARRIGHVNAPFLNMEKISRIPELSAIEEGNTVTSMSQFIPELKKVKDEEEQLLQSDNVAVKSQDDPNNNIGNRSSYTVSNFEPLISELDEDYITAEASSDPSSPVYPYFDAIDTIDLEDTLMGRRRNVPQAKASRRH
ncbi:bestrophin-4-like isoform X2 [Biomphalaria glabrata]|uniref:Bestrophin homolog n=1 Tax=Biomphalaria glabrata TaxID=6526 RepID=A0A9W2YV12_BIOGL|nr:bestrophin-4-like isoform X2 [Biomphalaria glabrata]